MCFSLVTTHFFTSLLLSLFLTISQFFSRFLVSTSLFSPPYSISPALFSCTLLTIFISLTAFTFELSLPIFTPCTVYIYICIYLYLYLHIYLSLSVFKLTKLSMVFIRQLLHFPKKSVNLSKLYEIPSEGSYAPPLRV